MNNTEAEQLYDTVIKNGYCIGCGSCAAVINTPFEMIWDKSGMLVAQPKSDLSKCKSEFLYLCPFSEKALSENNLSEKLFPDNMHNDIYLGRYLSCYAAYTKNHELRNRASSGGIGRWLAIQLIKNKMADFFVHVSSASPSNNNKTTLFEYTISTGIEEISNSSKSAYYPVTMAEVLKTIRSNPGSYIITGVPCFIKSIRLIALKDEKIRENIKYTFGIVCGSLKTNQYAGCIAWELGIHPNEVANVDFRKKYPDRTANHKGNVVRSKQGEEKLKSSKELFVTDYGMGFFKPKACDYCDDVVAELSDVSIGDAWIPEYVKDSQGTSIVIVRNKVIDSILKQAKEKGEIFLKPEKKEKIILSQAAGFRHRREGLAYRLHIKYKNKDWVPQKRVKPSIIGISRKRQLIYKLRELISQNSKEIYQKALENNSIDIFYEEMNPFVISYKKANRPNMFIVVINKLKSIFRSSN